MINENIYDNLMTLAETMDWSSMNYMDYEDLSQSEVVIQTPELILLKDTSTLLPELHFATKSIEQLCLTLQTQQLKGKLKFIPPTHVSHFEAIGFTIDCAFADFINPSLDKTVAALKPAINFDYATAEDAHNLAAISQTCKGQSRGFNGETAEWFIEWMNDGQVLVKRVDGAIVGFCCITIYNEGTTLWLRELAVMPEYQGKGFGRELMEMGLWYGVNQKAQRGFLAVDVENHNAIHLYKQLGFVQKENELEIQMIKNTL